MTTAKKSNSILISSMQFHNDLTGGAIRQIDLLDTAHRLGAGGLEIRDAYWREPSDEIPAIRQRASERNLVVTYATTATLFGDDDAAALLHQQVDETVALGAAFLRIFQGAAPENQADPAWERARRSVDYAASQGIVLALENFARAPGNRVTDIKAVLDAIPSPTLGTNVDIGNYAINDDDALTVIAALAPRIVASHLKDMRGPVTTWLGDGDFPVSAILAAFNDLPQPIIHCFEFEGGSNPEEVITASLRAAQAGNVR